METNFDVIIIGGGVAGYTAALYLSRANISVGILEKLSAGGQMATTMGIENYPGIEKIDGFELAEIMQRQAESFGAQTIYEEVESVDLNDKIKKVVTNERTLFAKAVVVATGATPRKLGDKNEERLVGRGVAYCATCDGKRYENKTVAVLGGGNSAITEALILSKIAQKVYIIHRRDSLRASKVYENALQNEEKIQILYNEVVAELLFDKRLNGIKIQNTLTNEQSTLLVDGVFVAIGREPKTDFLKGKVELDKSGYIIANEDTKTNVEGVFAIGDVRTKALRQIVTAASDGAVCSHYIEEYLANY